MRKKTDLFRLPASKRQEDGRRCTSTACLLTLFCLFFTPVFAPAQDLPKAVDDAKAGIVHIRSECMTNAGILETRQRTGFLVGEKGAEPCVVTTCRNLVFSDADIRRLTKQYQLEESEQVTARICMVFQGDVKVELNLIGKSDMLNLAVLRPGQSLTDKYILEFAGHRPEKGQVVYFLCFPPGKDQAAGYSRSTVQAGKTKVTNLAVRAGGSRAERGSTKKEDAAQFFYHGVTGGESILGGPFLDEKGRIVGMIVGAEQTKGSEKDNRVALTGKEIMKFLDLHNVRYTEEKMAAVEAGKKNRFPSMLGILTALLTILTVVRMVRMNGGRNQPKASLLRVSKGEKIPILRQRFTIGSVPVGNDYVAEGNRKVSRKHACISFENGKFCIEDLGSTNGTFIDESRLEPGRKQKLKDGAKLRLADEEFTIKIGKTHERRRDGSV